MNPKKTSANSPWKILVVLDALLLRPISASCKWIGEFATSLWRCLVGPIIYLIPAKQVNIDSSSGPERFPVPNRAFEAIIAA